VKKLTFMYREEPQGELFPERKRRRRLGKIYDQSAFFKGCGYRLNAMGWEGNNFVLDYRLSVAGE